MTNRPQRCSILECMRVSGHSSMVRFVRPTTPKQFSSIPANKTKENLKVCRFSQKTAKLAINVILKKHTFSAFSAKTSTFYSLAYRNLYPLQTLNSHYIITIPPPDTDTMRGFVFFLQQADYSDEDIITRSDAEGKPAVNLSVLHWPNNNLKALKSNTNYITSHSLLSLLYQETKQLEHYCACTHCDVEAKTIYRAALQQNNHFICKKNRGPGLRFLNQTLASSQLRSCPWISPTGLETRDNPGKVQHQLEACLTFCQVYRHSSNVVANKGTG